MIKRLSAVGSLKVKSVYITVLALLCSALVFFAVGALLGLYVEKSYMSDEAVSARKSEIYQDFKRYVDANSVSGRDSAAVARYTYLNEYATILVYSGSRLDIRAENGQAQKAGSMEDYELSMYAGMYGSPYPLRFADGLYQIAIGDSSQERVYFITDAVSIIAGALCFVVVIYLYMGSLSRRIIALSREAGRVGGGELERRISVPGNDEISRLVSEMDNMRRAVIERMGNESRAWKANSELITAISHDIRTPMTSMIGYLGLLNDSDFEDPERCRQFASSAYGKAMELKELTDELFKYFLVFGRAEPDIHPECFDGRLLLEQLISEAQFELTECGFNVKNIEASGDCSIEADPLYLKRVFDNLVSNVKKYADREKPVMIITELKENSISVCVSNYILRSMDRVESTRIGLRTCGKIMEVMGGSFAVNTDEEHFAAELTLPAGTGKAQ